MAPHSGSQADQEEDALHAKPQALGSLWFYCRTPLYGLPSGRQAKTDWLADMTFTGPGSVNCLRKINSRCHQDQGRISYLTGYTIGDWVIPLLDPTKWARVLDVHPGEDGPIRYLTRCKLW